MMDKYSRIRCLSREEKEDLILRITTSEYIDLMCDWAFKHVFGHNKDYLMMLLNDFLPVRIVGIDEVQYDPNEVDTFKGDDKQVIMDVLCHTETGHIIVEMQKSLGRDIGPGCRFSMMARLRQLGVIQYRLTTAQEIRKNEVVLKNEAGETFTVPSDTAVIAIGAKPLNDLEKALTGKIDKLHAIGDCVKTAKIMDAVEAAYFLAVEI